jgi:hypothetical protein
MCRHQYGANWNRDMGNKSHCPNLIPVSHLGTNGAVPVNVQYKEFAMQHESLVHFWNDWYKEYIHATFPRLIIRFEDVVFHPKEVTKLACECAGGRLRPNQKFIYITDSAKKGKAHGNDKDKTSYVDALVKYGTVKGRYSGYYNQDIEYANSHLDPNIMNLFGYQFSDQISSSVSSSSEMKDNNNKEEEKKEIM